MIRADQIPPEVVEAAAKAIYEAWCAFHGVTKTSMPWEDIDDEERQACIAEAIAAIAAALNAWPGAELEHDIRKEPRTIHLPILEASDE